MQNILMLEECWNTMLHFDICTCLVSFLHNTCPIYILQSGWSVSIDLVIGPDVGISYLTEKASAVCIR